MIKLQTTDLLKVTKRLHRIYQGQLHRAGPILAVLRVGAHLIPVKGHASPSPVAAHIVSAELSTWPDVTRYLMNLRPQGARLMGLVTYDAWSRRIADVCINPQMLLAYTVPLLIESQMAAIAPSPHRAQDGLLTLLSPILGSDAPLISDPVPVTSYGAENASIYAVLIAGKTPFVLTCHEKNTMSRWKNLLEAATVLLLPQLVVQAEVMLSESPRDMMRRALADELRSWRALPPEHRETRQWHWLPKLM